MEEGAEEDKGSLEEASDAPGTDKPTSNAPMCCMHEGVKQSADGEESRAEEGSNGIGRRIQAGNLR